MTDWRFLVRQTSLIWENTMDLSEAEKVIIGIPFDSTATGLSGAKLGPDRIREEFRLWAPSYDSSLGSLENVKVYDVGNVETIPGDPKETSRRIYSVVSGILGENPNVKIIILGGEHSITYPVVKALADSGKGFDYLCFDAHLDLLDSYLGLKESHASVNRRVSEIVGPDHMEIRGARIGEKEEWELARKLGSAKDPVYLSIDLDVLEGVPTGTPVPDGWTFTRLWNEIKDREWVAVDIVEYNPMLGVSPVPSELLRRFLLH